MSNYKMNGATLIVSLLIWWAVCNMVSGMPRPKDYRNQGLTTGTGEVINNKYDTVVNSEPSCEELKAMWRFSKRQSRAAEITNEIPTYRDPFSYNVWEPYYARSRSIGGMRTNPTYRNRPVYGRVVHKVPSFRVQDIVERNRAFEEVARLYGTVQRGTDAPRRRITAFRLGGGGIHVPQMGVSPQSGSFQHLKELIRTERARELQEQRMAEEVAARAAALKEISTGNNERHRQHQNLRDSLSYTYNMEEDPRDEQRKSMASSRVPGVLAFPDLLAPAARSDALDASLIGDQQEPEYIYQHDGPPGPYQRAALAPHRSMYGSSPYSDDLESGLML